MEVYLDNAATTKPSDKAIDGVLRGMKELYGNPSSLHRKGVEVEKEIKRIRKLVAKALGCNEQEIYFTSSGTEANNLAIKGMIEANKRKGNHIVTTIIEHKSVLNTFKELEEKGYEVTYLEVDQRGFILLDQLEKAIKDSTIFVSIMHVNNEVGSIQSIKAIGEIIKRKNPKTLFHVDGVQSFGKIKLSLGSMTVDSFSISAHKIHGPKGIGALYVRKGTKITPLLVGGSQEMGMRSGTENVPGILGLGEIVQLLIEEQEKSSQQIQELKSYLVSALKNRVDNIHISSEESSDFAPHIINVSFPGVRSEIMLHSLEQDGIYVSSGSACSSKKKGYSHVLEAMGMKDELIDSALRLSLSYTNTKEEIDYAVDKIKYHLEALRKIIKR